MPSCKEFEAKAVDKAVEIASEALNIPKDKLKYNVISYGSSGIFGIVGAKKARISVMVPEDGGKPSKRGRRSAPKRREMDTPTSESVSSILRETFGEDAPEPEPEPEPVPEAVPEPVSKPEPEAERPSEPSERDRIVEAAETRTAPEPPPADLEEAVEEGRRALRRILDLITGETDISVVSENGGIRYNVEGGEAGVLIGKRGQTLEAIQYLVEKIVNKQAEGRVRVQVDVEGYLDNRKANLEELARKMAEKTRKSGKPSSLGHMSAHDRRIVHLSLRDDGGVRTQSVGEGFYRKLVIFPNRKRRGRGN
jgi:spoIIIJ-associated protein